jgi:hypothetical protein
LALTTYAGAAKACIAAILAKRTKASGRRFGWTVEAAPKNLVVPDQLSLFSPTAPPVHFPTTLYRIIDKTILDQHVKPCWKNRPTLKLWREFAASERKRGNVPHEHPQARQKKLCFQEDLGGRLGR